MNKLLSITALTFLASTAFANTEVGDIYTGKHVSAEKAHAIQMGSNETYGSLLISQPADHKDAANLKGQQGEGELYADILFNQATSHKG